MWPKPKLEHANVTVRDPDATAALLSKLFGWRVRWRGPSKNGGYTVHVGTGRQYVAAYCPPNPEPVRQNTGHHLGDLNHLGIEVRNLKTVEQKVRQAGYRPHDHQAYEPGERFYFHDENGIEFEIISYKRPGRDWRSWSPIALATMFK